MIHIAYFITFSPLSERRYCNTWRHAVCVYACHISLGGEGNALYLVISSSNFAETFLNPLYRKIRIFFIVYV